MLRFSVVALSMMVACAGCGPGTEPSDAGMDGSVDAGRDAYVVDSGRCDLACMPGRACCIVEGMPSCVNLAIDALNCGACGMDCAAARRGTACEDFQCSCGGAEIGCTGDATSICCPPVAAGSAGYCGNLQRDANNCGTCGFGCEPARASQCEGGECTCGLSGAQCAGTREDRCCARDAEEPRCVDTTTAQDHCGICGLRCGAFQRCVDGECTSTFPDAGADAGAGDAGVDAD